MLDKGQFASILGRILWRRRKETGIGVIKYSHRVGISHTHIIRIERGETTISLHSLFRYCEGVGVRPSDLVRELENSLTEAERVE